MLLHVSIGHYILLMDGTPFCEYTTGCLSIHVLMSIGMFPILALTNKLLQTNKQNLSGGKTTCCLHIFNVRCIFFPWNSMEYGSNGTGEIKEYKCETTDDNVTVYIGSVVVGTRELSRS